MSTLRQLIFKVRNPNSGGKENRASDVTDRMIAEWIREARAILIYADVQKKGEVPPGYEMDLGCVELIKVDQADCGKYEWGEIVKKVTIPDIIELDNGMGIQFLGLIDKRSRISLPDQNYGNYGDHLPNKRKNWYEAMRIANAIYIGAALTQDKFQNEKSAERMRKLCAVNLRIIPADPTLVNLYGTTTGITPRCFDWDKDRYPVPDHLQGAMFTYIDQHYINPKVQLPKDLTNDEVNQAAV